MGRGKEGGSEEEGKRRGSEGRGQPPNILA